MLLWLKQLVSAVVCSSLAELLRCHHIYIAATMANRVVIRPERMRSVTRARSRIPSQPARSPSPPSYEHSFSPVWAADEPSDDAPEVGEPSHCGPYSAGRRIQQREVAGTRDGGPLPEVGSFFSLLDPPLSDEPTESEFNSHDSKYLGSLFPEPNERQRMTMRNHNNDIEEDEDAEDEYKLLNVVFACFNKGGAGSFKGARPQMRIEDIYDAPCTVMGLMEVNQQDIDTLTACRQGEVNPKWRAGPLWFDCCVLVKFKHSSRVTKEDEGDSGKHQCRSAFAVYKIEWATPIFGKGLTNFTVTVMHLNAKHARLHPECAEDLLLDMLRKSHKYQSRVFMFDLNMRAFALEKQVQDTNHKFKEFFGLPLTVCARSVEFAIDNSTGRLLPSVLFDSMTMMVVGPHNGIRRLSDTHRALAGACWAMETETGGTDVPAKNLAPGYGKSSYHIVMSCVVRGLPSSLFI